MGNPISPSPINPILFTERFSATNARETQCKISENSQQLNYGTEKISVDNKLISVGFPDSFLPELAGTLMIAEHFPLLQLINDVVLHTLYSFIHPIEEELG